jgi:hypothetical protein
MTSEKISSNEVEQSPYIYFYEGDPLANTLDPLAIRFIESGIQPTKIFLGSNFGGSDPGPDPDPDPNPNPGDEIGTMIPSLSDILIKGEQKVDYTTIPPTIYFTIQVKNSTGQAVKGLKIRRSL